jgi:phosphoserine phosphatase
VIDLDGTLVLTDMLHESALRALREKPLNSLRIPFWLLRGKAALKSNLADLTAFNPTSLPYNQDLVDWLKLQRAQGRKLILCTASDYSIATAISKHLDIFDEVIASDGVTNLAGSHKSKALEQRFGHAGFDYVGNSRDDLDVWQHARRAIVVNASVEVTKKAATYCKVERVFHSPPLGIDSWSRVLRLQQWLQNLLIFVPFLAAHQFTDLDTWLALIPAFFSFNLCASSVYIIYDLMVLESDRQHPHKHNRPFASGLFPVWIGVVLAPVLLFSSLVLALYVNSTFLTWLALYFLLTCIYLLGLKRLILVDCLILTMLYTLRIVAGASVPESLKLSFWLLASFVLLFFALVFLKRYAELGELC